MYLIQFIDCNMTIVYLLYGNFALCYLHTSNQERKERVVAHVLHPKRKTKYVKRGNYVSPTQLYVLLILFYSLFQPSSNINSVYESTKKKQHIPLYRSYFFTRNKSSVKLKSCHNHTSQLLKNLLILSTIQK